MNRNLGELAVTLGFGVLAILGFAASQSRQPYDLVQIRFCPESVNGIEGQIQLDNEFCTVKRYVLREDWERYGEFGSVIPYKGDAIQFVKDIPTDNPHQTTGNFAIAFGLWGMASVMYLRKNRLQHKDYEMSEQEKSYNYKYWLDEYGDRYKDEVDATSKLDIHAHKTSLHTEKVKDGLSALDAQQRDELGLSNPEARSYQAKLELEDFLKSRATKHSIQDKHYAENQLAIAKADAEREQILKQGLTTNNKQVKRGKVLHPSEEEAWKAIESIACANNSTALIAGSGSGKSVTLTNVLKIIIDKYGDAADILVVAAKNDSFYGLKNKGRVTLCGLDNTESAENVIDKFYNKYLDRKKNLTEAERKDLPPVLLILDDWLVVADQIKKANAKRPKEDKFDYSSKLLDIILIGREYNCKFIASLQSFNLAALGIDKVDSSVRMNFNLLALGNKYKKSDGSLLESYGVIEKLLTNHEIIPYKEDRERLKTSYQEVKPISQKELRPVMLASFGDYTSGLMPFLTKPEPDDVEKEKIEPYKEVSQWFNQKEGKVTEEELRNYWEQLTGEKPNTTELEILQEHISAIQNNE